MEIEEELDSLLEDVLSGRTSLEALSHTRPEVAHELEPMVRAASLFQGAAEAALPDAIRVAGEQRFLELAQQVRGSATSRTVPAHRSWIFRLASVCLACVIIVGSLSYASASALPGEPLYGVKRAGESVRLALAPPDQQVWLNLQLSQERLAELEELSAHGAPDTALLQSLGSSTAAAEAGLQQVDPDERTSASEALLQQVDREETVLDRLLSATPAPSPAAVEQVAVEQALKRSQEIHKRIAEQLQKAADDQGKPGAQPASGGNGANGGKQQAGPGNNNSNGTGRKEAARPTSDAGGPGQPGAPGITPPKHDEQPPRQRTPGRGDGNGNGQDMGGN